jgi:hypothetical protein
MLNEVKSRNTGRKIISFMHISLDGWWQDRKKKLTGSKSMNKVVIKQNIAVTKSYRLNNNESIS